MTTGHSTRGSTAGAALGLVRCTYGALQLTAPAMIAGLLLPDPLDQSARRTARVLGARHLLQALGSGRRPTYPVLALGVEVDALHAASMLACAIVDRGHRRAALTDAVIAGSFAIGGVYAARAAAYPHVVTESPGAFTRWRRRWTDRLAQILVPGYPGTAPHPPISHDRWAANS